eukprot:362159-Chlamydomonas_euryale.AAC.18
MRRRMHRLVAYASCNADAQGLVLCQGHPSRHSVKNLPGHSAARLITAGPRATPCTWRPPAWASVTRVRNSHSNNFPRLFRAECRATTLRVVTKTWLKA